MTYAPQRPSLRRSLAPARLGPLRLQLSLQAAQRSVLLARSSRQRIPLAAKDDRLLAEGLHEAEASTKSILRLAASLGL